MGHVIYKKRIKFLNSKTQILGFYIQWGDMKDTILTIVYFLSLDILDLLKKRTHSIIECPMSNFDRSGHKKNLENWPIRFQFDLNCKKKLLNFRRLKKRKYLTLIDRSYSKMNFLRIKSSYIQYFWKFWKIQCVLSKSFCIQYWTLD